MTIPGELARVTGLSRPDAGLGNRALVAEGYAVNPAYGVYHLAENRALKETGFETAESRPQGDRRVNPTTWGSVYHRRAETLDSMPQPSAARNPHRKARSIPVLPPATLAGSSSLSWRSP
jgi:hypothetical protein